MRGLLLVILASAPIAACGPSRASGPKWPEPSATAEDGGESIAPHPSATYAAAIEKSADASDDKPAAETTSSSAAASDDKPTTPTPSVSQPVIEDVFMTEEIIIEIDD
jgi:hypothetical protein